MGEENALRLYVPMKPAKAGRKDFGAAGIVDVDVDVC